MDDRHPLMELLSLSGLKMMANKSNYSLFTRLRDALILDNQSIVSLTDVEVHFQHSISSNEDLNKHQGELLHSMIKSWALNVLEPLVSAINSYTVDDVDVAIDVDGYLLDANVYFREDSAIDVYLEDMTLEYIVNNLDPEYMDDAKKLCADWKHTLAVIINGDDLAELIENK